MYCKIVTASTARTWLLAHIPHDIYKDFTMQYSTPNTIPDYIDVGSVIAITEPR